MDAYPLDYVEHNLPLIFLSGLASTDWPLPAGVARLSPQNGITVGSETPSLTGDRAELVLQEFLSADGSDAPWNGSPKKSKNGPIGFKLRAVGRVGWKLISLIWRAF
jgi:trafficking protein particle complex subunit 11